MRAVDRNRNTQAGSSTAATDDKQDRVGTAGTMAKPIEAPVPKRDSDKNSAPIQPGLIPHLIHAPLAEPMVPLLEPEPERGGPGGRGSGQTPGVKSGKAVPLSQPASDRTPGISSGAGVPAAPRSGSGGLGSTSKAHLERARKAIAEAERAFSRKGDAPDGKLTEQQFKIFLQYTRPELGRSLADAMGFSRPSRGEPFADQLGKAFKRLDRTREGRIDAIELAAGLSGKMTM